MTNDRLTQAFARFDAENARDPNRVAVGGVESSKELLYGQQMTAWQERLYPDASEVLRLAARCQHIRRWEVPRDTFPMDRAGYHRWRTGLYSFHADVAGGILRELGYDEATVARVGSLLRKERLKADPEVQALEDVICLVFLENYFAEFAGKHDDAKVVGILRRTWAKMSAHAHTAALSLKLTDKARELIATALG